MLLDTYNIMKDRELGVRHVLISDTGCVWYHGGCVRIAVIHRDFAEATKHTLRQYSIISFFQIISLS
jgi:hypothetical protein